MAYFRGFMEDGKFSIMRTILNWKDGKFIRRQILKKKPWGQGKFSSKNLPSLFAKYSLTADFIGVYQEFCI